MQVSQTTRLLLRMILDLTQQLNKSLSSQSDFTKKNDQHGHIDDVNEGILKSMYRIETNSIENKLGLTGTI